MTTDMKNFALIMDEEERNQPLPSLTVPIHRPVDASLLWQADTLIASALDAGMDDAKPFALVDRINPGATSHIDGPDWVWSLTPLEEFEDQIPPEALRAISWVRTQSIAAHGLWIAAPFKGETEAINPGPLLTIATADILSAAIRRAANGVKRAAGGFSGLGQRFLYAALGFAFAPVVAVAAFSGVDPVLLVQISVPDGPEAVLIELARWQ